MELNRRDFLKGGAVLGGVAAVAAVGCTAPEAVDEKKKEEVKKVELPYGVTEDFIKDSKVELDPITTFAKEETYDIVVVGAGTAGTPALLTAAEEGATVGVLQREATAQGNGNGSSGIILEESNTLGMKQYFQNWRVNSGYRLDSDLLQLFMDHSGETTMWMYKKGDAVGYLPYSGSATKNTYEDGKGYCTAVLKSFGPKPENHGTIMRKLCDYAEKEKGVKFYYSTPCVQLVQDASGKVTGAIGKQADGTYVKLNANKAVIIAAGDYQNNESMVKYYSPDVVRFQRKQSNRTGDGILLSALAGGFITPANHAKTMHDMDAMPMAMTGKPMMALNEKGERFMNEDIPMASWDLALRERPLEVEDPGHFFRIYDNDWPKKYGGSSIASLENYIPGFKAEPYNVYTDLIDTYRCDTLDELAGKLGIPASALKKSVEKWNAMCETGEDTEFGLKSTLMKKIETAPYWGTRQWIRCSAINSGIEINYNCQVVNSKNEVIPGLYSVGSGAGSICGGLEWNLAQGGLCCGFYMTMGRYAALHAVNGKMESKNPAKYEECKSYWAKK